MHTIIIVGGGAAGLMAAVSASYEGKKVLLLEKNEKVGKKLFITGKGRCNITNACDPDEFLANVVTNPRFLYSSFSRFNNEDMMQFLKKAGLAIKTERGQRVFPESDRSADVIDTLKKECKKNGVTIRCNTEVEALLFEEKAEEKAKDKAEDKVEEKGSRKDNTRVCTGVRLKGGKQLLADAVILACGGCSYASTGSTGEGYEIAESAGHKVKAPEPSLVPFLMQEKWCRDLMGLTLKNISILVKAKKKTVYEGFGEFLFTHFGVSGPLVLTASTRLGAYQKQLKAGELRLILDLKPALSAEQLDKRFLREFDTWRNKNISNVIDQLLPAKMVPVFLEMAGVPTDKKVRDISKKERQKMVFLMKNLEMHITGTRGFDEAIVTRGGVNIKEIDPATMQSKKTERLFFAGEMMDLDAVTGGFNLQIAWTTGYAAGKNA